MCEKYGNGWEKSRRNFCNSIFILCRAIVERGEDGVQGVKMFVSGFASRPSSCTYALTGTAPCGKSVLCLSVEHGKIHSQMFDIDFI
jgi:hypothetical protein